MSHPGPQASTWAATSSPQFRGGAGCCRRIPSGRGCARASRRACTPHGEHIVHRDRARSPLVGGGPGGEGGVGGPGASGTRDTPADAPEPPATCRDRARPRHRRAGPPPSAPPARCGRHHPRPTAPSNRPASCRATEVAGGGGQPADQVPKGGPVARRTSVLEGRRPSESGSARATRHLLRSPGGRISKAARKRPLDPPRAHRHDAQSSRIEARRSQRGRQAVPPPRATTLGRCGLGHRLLPRSRA